MPNESSLQDLRDRKQKCLERKIKLEVFREDLLRKRDQILQKMGELNVTPETAEAVIQELTRKRSELLEAISSQLQLVDQTLTIAETEIKKLNT